MYKLVNDNEVVLKQVNGVWASCIPFDPANTDYQQYLAWVAEGNTPQEADDAAN